MKTASYIHYVVQLKLSCLKNRFSDWDSPVPHRGVLGGFLLMSTQAERGHSKCIVRHTFAINSCTVECSNL